MCGFIYNVTDFPLLEPLFDIAGYSEEQIKDILSKPGLRPTDRVLNLVPTRHGPKLLPATWWLATHADGSPNTAITSFNARADRLQTAPLHLRKPRSVRSIVLASGFCEWQVKNRQKDLFNSQASTESKRFSDRQQILVEQEKSALMLLGAVSKLRRLKNGCAMVNTAIITLGPHSEFKDIHSKSFPLVLEPPEIERWIEPRRSWDEYTELLTCQKLRQPYRITEVDDQLTAASSSWSIGVISRSGPVT